MKLSIKFVKLSILTLIITSISSLSYAQVEYVRICDLYGAGFYYIAGSDTCILPTTGETRSESPSGVIVGQSKLAWRISQLESKLKELKQAKNNIKEKT